METVFSIISVIFVLVLFGYVVYKARGFASRSYGSKAKRSPAETGSENINRTSPFNAQASFETAMELLPEKKPEYLTFEPIKYHHYEDTEIILLTRNPYWLYSYWHINHDTIQEFNNRYGDGSWEASQSCLKLNNLTHNKEYFIHINNFADSWYIKVGEQLVEWKTYYGKIVPEKGFLILAESNIAMTPAAKPSDIFDTDWLPDDELWIEFYQKGFFTDICSEEFTLKNN